MTEAGATEPIRLSVTDLDGDPVTLSVGISMVGVRPAVSGQLVTYPAPVHQLGTDSFTVTASDGRGGEGTCEVSVLVQDRVTSPSAAPDSEPGVPTPDPNVGAPLPPSPASVTPSVSSTPPVSTLPAPPTGEGSTPPDTPAATATTRPTTSVPAAMPGGSSRPGIIPSSPERTAPLPTEDSMASPPLPPGPGTVAGTATAADGTTVPRPSASDATAEGTRTTVVSHATDRAGTEATAGVFAAVGAVLVALIGLVAMALPRGRHRH